MADNRFTLTWDEVHRADSKKIGGQICLRTCPWCGHNDYRLKIDPDTGAYFCHDDKCEAKGVVTNGEGAGETWRPNMPEVHAKAPDKPKKFLMPDLSRAQGINQQVIDYMATRGISEETCRKMRLGFENHPSLGPLVIFPSFDKAGQKVINVKYRKIASKDFRNSPDTYRPFFGLTTLTEPAQPVIIVEGECLTGDAEVLTPQGWVRFDQYSGQPVAQVHEGGAITMTDPLAIVRKQYTGDLLRFQNSQRFQTTVTP